MPFADSGTTFDSGLSTSPCFNIPKEFQTHSIFHKNNSLKNFTRIPTKANTNPIPPKTLPLKYLYIKPRTNRIGPTKNKAYKNHTMLAIRIIIIMGINLKLKDGNKTK